jgi:protein-S-isoprenylcysteine O-methyltransferase Ste14
MAGLALALYVVYFALAFGVRIALQVRRTGKTGVVGVSGRPGSLEWWGGALFVAALAVCAAAPVLDLTEAVEPVGALDTSLAHATGIVLACAGILATFAAQLAMGDSWRIGVDESERTDLVTGGVFALVRNPIYSAMLPTVGGLALMAPSVVALLGWIALLTALELQTRGVEEPYLLRVHGERYAQYAARVGRFIPGVGLRRLGSEP